MSFAPDQYANTALRLAPRALSPDTESSLGTQSISPRFISISQVPPPSAIQLRDSNLAPVFMRANAFRTAIEKAQDAIFDREMIRCRDALGGRMFEALVARSKLCGFDPRLDTHPMAVPMGSDQVDAIESEALLQVTFADVGFATRLWSEAFEPRVNVMVRLSFLDGSRRHFTELFYYGANASGETAWSIPADPGHVFSNHKALLGSPDAVADAFTGAIGRLSARIVQRVAAQMASGLPFERRVGPRKESVTTAAPASRLAPA